MEVYYCGKCPGRPYTRKVKSGINCPVCKTPLKCEDVNEETLEERPILYGKELKQSIEIPFLNFFKSDNKEEKRSLFNICSDEKYYLYLGFIKKKKRKFICKFIVGNEPDKNGVISKTPFISSDIEFSERLEITMLERFRNVLEREVLLKGWRKDTSVYYAFLKNKPEVVEKSKIELISGDVSEKSETKESMAERYFIQYVHSSYGSINVKNPLKNTEDGILDEIQKVHEYKNEKYMRKMFFRSKNGEIMDEINSFADASAVVFDQPYINLIRYDKVMKEVAMERF